MHCWVPIYQNLCCWCVSRVVAGLCVLQACEGALVYICHPAPVDQRDMLFTACCRLGVEGCYAGIIHGHCASV